MILNTLLYMWWPFIYLFWGNVYWSPLPIFLKDFIDLFLETGERKEKERERNINVWLPLVQPSLGTWSATQACALTGNRTSNALVHRHTLNPLSYTSQGWSPLPIFNQIIWFLLLSFKRFLYIGDINHSLVGWFANIFSHFIGCLFSLLIVSLAVQKFFNLT